MVPLIEPSTPRSEVRRPEGRSTRRSRQRERPYRPRWSVSSRAGRPRAGAGRSSDVPAAAPETTPLSNVRVKLPSNGPVAELPANCTSISRSPTPSAPRSPVAFKRNVAVGKPCNGVQRPVTLPATSSIVGCGAEVVLAGGGRPGRVLDPKTAHGGRRPHDSATAATPPAVERTTPRQRSMGEQLVVAH